MATPTQYEQLHRLLVPPEDDTDAQNAVLNNESLKKISDEYQSLLANENGEAIQGELYNIATKLNDLNLGYTFDPQAVQSTFDPTPYLPGNTFEQHPEQPQPGFSFFGPKNDRPGGGGGLPDDRPTAEQLLLNLQEEELIRDKKLLYLFEQAKIDPEKFEELLHQLDASKLLEGQHQIVQRLLQKYVDKLDVSPEIKKKILESAQKEFDYAKAGQEFDKEDALTREKRLSDLRKQLNDALSNRELSPSEALRELIKQQQGFAADYTPDIRSVRNIEYFEYWEEDFQQLVEIEMAPPQQQPARQQIPATPPAAQNASSTPLTAQRAAQGVKKAAKGVSNVASKAKNLAELGQALSNPASAGAYAIRHPKTVLKILKWVAFGFFLLFMMIAIVVILIISIFYHSGSSDQVTGRTPPSVEPPDLAADISDKFGITMVGYDHTHLRWAWEKFYDISDTRFISLVRGKIVVQRVISGAHVGCLGGYCQAYVPDYGGSHADSGDKDIFDVILLHEVGHIIQWIQPSSVNHQTELTGIIAKEGYLTFYSRINCLHVNQFYEDFAETMTYYLNPTVGQTTGCGHGPNPYSPNNPYGVHSSHFNFAQEVLGVYP